MHDGLRELAAEMITVAVADLRGSDERQAQQAWRFLQCAGCRHILEGLGIDYEAALERLQRVLTEEAVGV